MPIYSPITNKIVFSGKELEKCGLSSAYLKRVVCGQKKGEVYCWASEKIGGRLHFQYDSLLPKYQAMLRLIFCKDIEPDVYLKNRTNDTNNSVLTAIADQLPGLVQIDATDLKTLMDTQLYSATEAHQLARAAGWLRMLNEYDVKRVRSVGYKSIVDFQEAVFKHVLNEQVAHQTAALIRWKKGTITSIRVLLRNAVEYKRDGIQSLVHKGVGNVNREKADAQVHAKLIELASNRVKYSWEDVSMMYNNWADEVGKPNMTTSAVKSYLNIPKVKRVWYYARHGKLAGDLELQPLIQRDAPSFPDALWSIDGTTMQLYYKDDKGKMLSDLYAYFVTDAHTGAIIGHSIAFAETAEMVTEALKDAIDTHQNKPYQLQYDNSSANLERGVQAFASNMSRVHFPCEPYKGQGKYVESIIGHFQQRVLRHREFFKGGNITTRSLNSKANPELLAELKKNPERLLTRIEIINEFKYAIAEWNARGEKRDSYGRWVGESKIHRYETIQHEKRAKLNYFDKLSMFVTTLKQQYKYSTRGIEIEISKKKYTFIVPDGDNCISHFLFTNEHLGEKFEVRLDVSKPEMCTLLQKGIVVAHAYPVERVASCVADKNPGDGAKLAEVLNKRKEFDFKSALTELERQMSILGELKPTGTDGLGWWDTDKTSENARNNRMEDAANGITNGYSDLELKILNIGQ